MITTTDRIFDTLQATQKIYVSMKERFLLREYDLKDGRTSVQLTITPSTPKIRIHLDINVWRKDWNPVTQRLIPTTKENQDINLVLDNIKSKLTSIKTSYRLSDRVLTAENLKKEFLNGMPRVRFTAFYKNMLEEEKVLLELGTYNRYKSVLKKIVKYDNDVTFQDLDLKWIQGFRKHLKSLGNENTTVSGNIAAVKKFLGIAFDAGIKLALNVNEIKPGSTRGNRTSLTTHELKRCCEYYFSPFINDSHRLILGYFLFSCMTGLRISDVQKLTRKNFIDDYFTFIAKKGKKDQSIALNMKARQIVDFEPNLFVKKFADQHINDELKKIMGNVKVHKKVTFHVGRHTFATCFLRAGGHVTKLQLLLGHSDINETMIYVHIVQAEANAEVFLIDNLF